MKLWTFLGMAAVGRSSWMQEILGDTLIFRGGPGLVLCPAESRRLLLVWLLWVPCLLVFRSSWSWFEVSVFLLVYVLLRPLMCLPPRSVHLGLLFLGRCGPVRCLWLTLLFGS